MANDKRFIVKNGLRSQNVEFTDSQDGSNQITLNMLNTDTLNFEGDAGSLFSISDDLTGTVFSVSDISGIPIIEVIGDTHNVTFNEFDGKVMIGGTDSGGTDSDVLNVTGNVRATAYYGDGSNLSGISASGGVDSTAVSAIITADVDKAFVDALNVDADTFDGVNSTQFLRSDVADTKNGGDLSFSDNIKAVFGTGSDLEIYHDGSNSIINDAGTGYLIVQGAALGTTAGNTSELLNLQNTNSNTNRLRIFQERDASGSDWTTAYTRIQQIIDVTEMSYIQFNGDGKTYGMEFGTNGDELYQKNVRNGQVELYYDNSKKFETVTGGVTITGTATATTFSGSGASLTSIPAGQLTGTVSDARLPASISSDITGNAATATILSTARNIDITGVTATAQSFDGSGDIAIEVTAVPSSLLTGTVSDARLPASISSDITGNAATATTATNITAVANNSTNETVYITFVDGATGTQGIETDTALSYNPSSNTLTAGVFSGSGASLSSLNASNLSSGTVSDARLPASISSDITGNAATATALATGRNIDVTGVTATAASFDGTGDIDIEVTAVPSSLLTGTISDARLPASISSDITGNAATATTATTATNVTATANNSTNETVYITFVDGTTGGQGIETDINLSYNPSSNTLTAGVFSGSGASLTNLPSGQLSGALPAIDGSSLTSVDAETLDGVNSTSFLRSDTSDNYTSGTLTFNSGTQLKLTSNSSIPVLDIDGGGPNFIRFTDNGSTTDAVNIVYRTTPNDLRIERSTNDNIIAEFGGDDGHAALFFDGSQKLTTVTGGVTISGTVTATAFSGDGSALTGIAAGSSVSVSLTAPGSPSEGDMWYDPEYGNLLVYYTDSDTSQWVTTNAPGVPDNSINSSKFSNAVSLVIYDSSGSAVKTLYSPDN